MWGDEENSKSFISQNGKELQIMVLILCQVIMEALHFVNLRKSPNKPTKRVLLVLCFKDKKAKCSRHCAVLPTCLRPSHAGHAGQIPIARSLCLGVFSASM